MENEAERYKIIQQKSGISKTAFAESIGISRSHNYTWKKGRRSRHEKYWNGLQMSIVSI